MVKGAGFTVNKKGGEPGAYARGGISVHVCKRNRRVGKKRESSLGLDRPRVTLGKGWKKKKVTSGATRNGRISITEFQKSGVLETKQKVTGTCKGEGQSLRKTCERNT